MKLTRDHIASTLKGQSFRLPDFEAVHKDWPFATSPHLDYLREESDKFIQWLSTQKWIIADMKKVSKKLKAVNIEIYLAKAYPDDSRDTLRKLLHAELWMFLWDDEVDSVSGDLGRDFEAAQKFREATLQYMKYALHLSNESANHLADDVLISSFSAIANPLLDCTEEARRDFCDALQSAILATVTEQKHRLSPYLPELTGYLEARYHSIGVPMNRILHCAFINSSIYASPRPEIKDLIYHSTMITAMANDIMSLRKELRTETPDSLVPILWQDTQDLQAAVDKACSMMEDSRRRFDRAERTLLQVWPKEELGELKMFVKICQTQVTGNYEWTLQAKRYGLAECKVGDEYIVRLD